MGAIYKCSYDQFNSGDINIRNQTHIIVNFLRYKQICILNPAFTLNTQSYKQTVTRSL